MLTVRYKAANKSVCYTSYHIGGNIGEPFIRDMLRIKTNQKQQQFAINGDYKRHRCTSVSNNTLFESIIAIRNYYAKRVD